MGELPPEVYWRRRVVAIGLLVLVVLVLFYLVRPLFSGDDPDPKVTPSVTPTPATSPTAAAVAAGPCAAIDMAIEMTATPRDSPKGSIPTFDVSFINTGFEACTLDTSKGPELHITSGSDRIWNSDDCPGGNVLTERTVTLAPDETFDTSVSWPRIRSNSQCSATLPAPRPGTYHAILTVQGVESNDTTFTLSN